ncbi:MAG: galactose mutarotase [Oscillospiraceae bacterium]|jgi:aldose 1-epimerase|nr:galactose mutarotase [Oscillospiraceae bacterium]
MPIQKQLYGNMPNGEEVFAFTVTGDAIRARILTYGATLDALFVPDRSGRLGDILLGFDSLEDRMAHSAYQGESVGRCANRIAGAKFSLNGKQYVVEANENKCTCLHGGGEFSRANWSAEPLSDTALRLTYQSPAGAMGFPGNMLASALYELENNALRITYTATADAETPCNLTNHAYFNLRGEGDVRKHILRIRSDTYLPIDAASIPTGERRAVAGTPFDFNVFKQIDRAINTEDPQIVQCKGLDHNYCIAGDPSVPAAKVLEVQSGRTMELYTNQPGVQVYTGNFLDSPGKGGTRQSAHSGFCLETQAWPDALNRSDFPPCSLRPGEEYKSVTLLKFGVVN